MTTHGTLAAVTPGIQPQARSNLVRALTATHFVSRAGGVARSFLVLYLTQERQLSPMTAGVVLAAVGVGDVGSQLLGDWPPPPRGASAPYAVQQAIAPALRRRTSTLSK